jgi:UDPglucose 6-dehydrogenase
MRPYDPQGMAQAKRITPDISYCDDPYSAAKGAEVLIIVTEWEQFRALDLIG